MALSEGALQMILNGGRLVGVDAPIVQILKVRKVSGEGPTAHYRLLVSDGLYTNSFVMLASKQNDKVSNGELEEYTIIRITRYITSIVPNSVRVEMRLMSIVDLEVMTKGADVGKCIGNPQPLIDQPSPPADNVPAPSCTPSPGRRNGEAKPTSISDLRPYMSKGVLQGRVVKKMDIINWRNARGQGKLFSFDIMDESAEIRVTAFNNDCDRFYDLIQVGKVYEISRVSIKPSNKLYNHLSNDYELTLRSDSQIILVLEDIAKFPNTSSFNFSPLSAVENLAAKSPLDIVGVCRTVGTVKIFSSTMKQREIRLVDSSMVSVVLILWGQEAEEFNGEGQPVVAVKRGVVHEHRGTKSVSAIYSSSVFVNPDIPEAHQLRRWYDTEGSTLNYENISKQTVEESEADGFGILGSKITWLDEIIISHDAQGKRTSYYTCTVTILAMKSASAIYNSCPTGNCFKKVVDLDNGLFRCEKCNQEYSHCRPRLLLQVLVADWSTCLWVTFFDDTAKQILGHSALELRALKDQDPEAYQRVFDDSTYTKKTLNIRVQDKKYNDEIRLNFNVVSAKPVDHVAYTKALLEESKELFK